MPRRREPILDHGGNGGNGGRAVCGRRMVNPGIGVPAGGAGNARLRGSGLGGAPTSTLE